MAEVERVGHVSEITPPPEGTNRPWSGKVGGRKVKFWGTTMGSDDPSAALVTMRDAENRGLPVRAVGLEEIVQGRNGSFTSFTAKTITLTDSVPDPVAAAQNGSASPATFQDGNRDRSIIAQVAHKIAATLVASGAVSIEDPKTSRGSLEAFKAVADYIFYGIIETAEGKATGGAESQGEWATQ